MSCTCMVFYAVQNTGTIILEFNSDLRGGRSYHCFPVEKKLSPRKKRCTQLKVFFYGANVFAVSEQLLCGMSALPSVIFQMPLTFRTPQFRQTLQQFFSPTLQTGCRVSCLSAFVHALCHLNSSAQPGLLDGTHVFQSLNLHIICFSSMIFLIFFIMIWSTNIYIHFFSHTK